MNENLNEQLLKNTSAFGNFSVASIMGGFVFGIIGFYLFRDGKKNFHMRRLVLGILLMVYPWFVSDGLWVWLIGITLCLFAYYFRY